MCCQVNLLCVLCLPLVVVLTVDCVGMQLVKVMEDCWNTEPDKRPTMAQVAHSMHSIAQAVKRRARTEHQSRATLTSPHV